MSTAVSKQFLNMLTAHPRLRRWSCALLACTLVSATQLSFAQDDDSERGSAAQAEEKPERRRRPRPKVATTPQGGVASPHSATTGASGRRRTVSDERWVRRASRGVNRIAGRRVDS